MFIEQSAKMFQHTKRFEPLRIENYEEYLRKDRYNCNFCNLTYFIEAMKSSPEVKQKAI
jgi:hypothetical protein